MTLARTHTQLLESAIERIDFVRMRLEKDEKKPDPQRPNPYPTFPVDVWAWLEHGYLDNKTWWEETVTAIAGWSKLVDIVVITTMPEQAYLYGHLQAIFPKMRFIPCLKMFPFFHVGDRMLAFDDLGAWRKIALEVSEFLDWSGGHTIIFDHETSLRPFMENKETIDLNEFRACLQSLPKKAPDNNPIDIVWYPGVMGAQDNRLRGRVIQQIVVAELGARFTGHFMSNPASWKNHEQSRSIRKDHRKLVGSYSLSDRRFPLELLHTETPDGPPKWPYAHVPTVLQHVCDYWSSRATTLIFPGHAQVDAVDRIRKAMQR